MYILVREDLSVPQQTVQACHAAISAAELYLGRPVDNLVVCGVKDELALHKARDRLDDLGIRLKTFTEPDIGNQLTALATEPVFGETRLHFRKFKLLRGKHNDRSST